MYRILRWRYYTIQKDPTDDGNDKIGGDFSPEHVDVGTSQWIAISSCLLDGFPDRQQAEAKRKAGCQGGDLDVTGGSHGAMINVSSQNE